MTALHVADGRSQTVNVISELAKAAITWAAEDASQRAIDMRVIDVHSTLVTVEFVRSADRADAALFSENTSKLRRFYAVSSAHCGLITQAPCTLRIGELPRPRVGFIAFLAVRMESVLRSFSDVKRRSGKRLVAIGAGLHVFIISSW